MKASSSFRTCRRLRPVALALVLGMFAAPTAHARTITLSLEFTRIQFSVFDPYNPGQTFYTVKTLVSSDVPPVTYDEVDSSTNNSAFGGSENGYGYGYYGDIGSAVNAATNGAWTLTVNKGDISQKQYTFTVSTTGLPLNNTNFPAVQITTPVDGNPAVSSNSAFAWTGPATWNELDLDDHSPDYSFYAADSPSPATTNWSAAPLPLGTNLFEVTYKTNAAAWITISTPLDNLSHPFTNWVGGAKLVDYAQSGFVTSTNSPTVTVGHTLIAHYAFDNSGNLGLDSTGQGNDINCGSSWGPGHVFTTNAVAGGGAVQFFGGSSMTPCGQAFTSWTNTLAGSFTVSAWINTTNVVGNDGDNLNDGTGQSVVYADNNDLGATPVALTGTKAAFRTTDPGGHDDTLHSLQSITTGSYVHIVATRDQATGEKKLYINGTLDSSDFAGTNSLTGAQYVSIGGESGSAYRGVVDDVQIYSGVLSASEVAYLYNNPGTNVADIATNSPELNTALGTTNLNWATSGSGSWFVETTNTYNGSPAAAQSGSINNYQTTTLSTTVTGPGTLTFYWSSQDNDPGQNMDYEFYIDDPNTNDIADLYGGGNAWQSIEASISGGGPVIIQAGQHTLYWTVYANGDADPNMAGFLDNVVFTPTDTSPVSANITLNIYREQDPTFGDMYVAFPSFNAITPAGTGTTTNVIQSPNGYFNSHADQGGGGSGSAILFSLGSVLNECTNGLWSLYINQGMPDQRQFQFSVAINGLTTNLLPAVNMITPTNGTTGFPSTAALQWLGPTNYTSLNVSKQNIDGSAYVGTTLPVTATSWMPGLIVGTNQCNISYASNNFPGVSFSVPVDSVDSQTAAVWSAQVNLNTTAAAIFVVTAGASHVTLLNPKTGGGNFQFSFLSQTGFTNTVQYRTNLTVGSWQIYTNIPGDGTSKTSSIPFSIFSPSRQGFIRVSTQ
ncbi:MAG TPA: LamG domain-containing protein [Verrucomicrobiae bacterium]|nr:LamG domain-containing protein [Verrucomicrobiae bacterium]